MDAVITYVNGADPEWLKDYESATGEPLNPKRFRDWGTLKFLLRGIREHLPFVRNVYLVVSRRSQVPAWADTSRLKVVLHGDIVPSHLLPLFNGASIEMFLHRIEGLDEEFLYFNDDFFPVRDCSPEYFFKDGKAAAHFHPGVFSRNMYKYHCLISDSLAREAAGRPRRPFFIRPQHTCQPMLRSVCEDLYCRYGDRLLAKVTPLRVMENYNHYVFIDYAHYLGRTFHRKVSNRHFSTAVAPVSKVRDFLLHPDADFACINDVNMPPEKYDRYRTALLDAFGSILPAKSPFEI